MDVPVTNRPQHTLNAFSSQLQERMKTLPEPQHLPSATAPNLPPHPPEAETKSTDFRDEGYQQKGLYPQHATVMHSYLYSLSPGVRALSPYKEQ